MKIKSALVLSLKIIVLTIVMFILWTLGANIFTANSALAQQMSRRCGCIRADAHRCQLHRHAHTDIFHPALPHEGPTFDGYRLIGVLWR